MPPERLAISRDTGAMWEPDPLSWRGLRDTDGRRSATMTCRNGHGAALTDHEIAANGDVSPSVVCPHPGCTFHAWVTLVKW